jgi:hypothetical protein
MAKISLPTPTATPAPPENRPSTSRASQVQSTPSKPKAKKRKKAKKGQRAVSINSWERGTRQDRSTDYYAENAKASQDPATSKTSTKTEPPQNLEQNTTVTQSSIHKGKGIETPETPKQTNSNSIASTSNDGATAGSSPVVTNLAILPESSISESSSPMLLNRTPKISNMNDEIFRLAAATPVPISPTVERQFHESHLLLYVLEKVRGEHRKRQNYHGELDQGETELRRSFVDKLAYICDFKKGGSTVTALALQKTYQGVTFWIAANETVKLKAIEFLQQILQLLKNVDSSSRDAAETQLLALVVPFNKERLEYYWSALKHHLPVCMKRLDDLEGSTGKLSPRVTLW